MMTNCPKCRGCKIMGPTFIRKYLQEFLRYVCMTCGYETTTPTADNK